MPHTDGGSPVWEGARREGPKGNAKYQMMNCACKDASGAGQGVSY